MGEGGLTPAPRKSFTEFFEEVFPIYLALGMTYELFWLGDPLLVKAYRQADELRRKRENGVLWLQGLYVAEALQATVGNMFTKGQKHVYPEEPYPVTQAEQQERREREQRAKMERIKAAFTARALGVNAKLGGDTNG